MATRAEILAQYPDEIDEAVERFGDHEDMSVGRVTRWLSQFEDADLPLALKTIQAIHYVNRTNLKALTKQLLEDVRAEMAGRNFANVRFVAVDPRG